MTSAAELLSTLNELQNTFSIQLKECHDVAADSYLRVTSGMEVALKMLSEVVTIVHATYTEDGSLDQQREDILRNMKTSFEDVEQKAMTNLQALGSSHERITAFQNEKLVPLRNQMNVLLEISQREIAEAQNQHSKLENRIFENDDTIQENDRVLNSDALPLVESGIGRAALGIADFFTGNSGDSGLVAQRDRLVQHVNELRETNQRLRREKDEAGTEISRLQAQEAAAKNLVQRVGPFTANVEDMSNKIDNVKAPLIIVKEKATSLAKEATKVAANASTTSTTSYDKSDFAFGIMTLCSTALFDSAIKDEIELIVAELIKAWTSDGVLTMNKRLKAQLDTLQMAITNFNPIPELEQWKQSVDALDYSPRDIVTSERNGEEGSDNGFDDDEDEQEG
ncbi:hypothetical protein FKW77_009126 [Venturia effusa]|uniref:Uncharacterized protein n=1 Tax=Venturia effusa TaxID=50376 RepID=A0A517L1Y0_9PEZI|nr:hypothetical protein FKW77_009126 [Venturia effusa]